MLAKLKERMWGGLLQRHWVLASALFFVLGGGTGQARELCREGFEGLPEAAQSGAVAGRDGLGWRQGGPGLALGAPVSFAGVQRGSISFDLRRVATRDPHKTGTVFEFLDREGRRVFRMMVTWAFEPASGRTAFRFPAGGSEFGRSGLGSWSPLVLLDREVAPGQGIHVDLSWDDGTKEYRLYVDGQPVEGQPGNWDPAKGGFVADGRRSVYGAPTSGRPTAMSEEPFGSFLARAERLVIGRDDRRRPIGGREPALLSHAVIDNFVIVVDESVTPVTQVRGQGYDVRGLAGTHAPEGVRLTWEPPEVRGVNQGYFVYRRAREGQARFERLTPERVYDLTYVDTTARAGESYRYSVTAVYADGQGGDLESKVPPEVAVTAAALSVASVAAEKTLYGAGQEVIVTLQGTPGGVASFTLAGVVANRAMTEVGDGIYVGRVAVPAGLNLAAAALTATLTKGADAVGAEGPAVGVDTAPPAAPGRVLATAPWAGEVELGWVASVSGDVAGYRVYRGEGEDPDVAGRARATVKGTAFVDTGLVPGLEVRYAVVAVDQAGNASAPSEVVSATVVAGEGPALSAITVEPFGKPVKPGQAVSVIVTGQSGGRLTVDLGTLAADVALAEQGRSGRYLGSYLVKDADVGPTKGLHRVVAKLTDAFGRSSLAGPEIAIVGRDALNDATPPMIAKASHDGFQVAGFSGKLVAGDVVSVTLEGEPAGYASFDLGGVAQSVTMAETKPGVYQGTYTVGWKDEGVSLAVVGRLADEGGNEATLAVGRPVSLDTRVRLAVAAKDGLLPADKKSTTRLVAKATDANGDEVSGHELALTLSTTEEYTGVVGGGRLEGKAASKDDEDDLEVKWGGVTSAFGEVAATYTAGFAAKTALIVAKNLTTGDVGAGWLNTYVASTVAIELVPRAGRAAAQGVLSLTAEPPWLTADGRSTSRVKVAVTDLSGSPVKGVRVAFALGNQNGRLRVLRDTTDEAGLAAAEYRAGTLAGTVTVTASAADLGVAGSLQIDLRADAPAKIDLAGGTKLVFGDQTTLVVRVTDINDNPTPVAPVRFTVLKGGGRVTPALLTDRNGEGQATYHAGNAAGQAIVEARHTSRAPTQVELQRVQGTIFVPRLAERQERDRIKVTEWLVKAGKEVEKGRALVVLEGGKGTWTLTAPEKGVLVRHVKHERDRVELGDTLGYVEIDDAVWADLQAR